MKLSKIELAKEFATKAHEGQLRKYTGKPYITHPTRVAFHASAWTDDEDVIAAAWLHDVIEDCSIEYFELQYQFGDKVAQLVFELTNVYTTEAYPELNRAKRKKLELERLAKISDAAKPIKLIDRYDNLCEIPLTERGFLVKYLRESRDLLETLRGVHLFWDNAVEEQITYLEKQLNVQSS